ncbi:MAG: BspA family leucine-rich repeat surface protein [Bacteroidota bacterium]
MHRLITILIFLIISSPIFSQPFITTWKTNNVGPSNNSSITIPTTGSGYNYDVDWNNDGIYDEFGITGDVTHNFGTPGTYTIAIQGQFPRIFFNFSGDRYKLISIDQWGSNPWSSMKNAFHGCQLMQLYAVDVPDLSNVTNISSMFRDCVSMEDNDFTSWDVSTIVDMSYLFSGSGFEGDVSNWDVSNVTDMSHMFSGDFNGDISTWDVSNVTDMSYMFNYMDEFNADISNWDVSKVTNMKNMFQLATSFNIDIGNWDVSSVTNMDGMFFGTEAFNRDLHLWDVSSLNSMVEMFGSTIVFNGDITTWDVSNVSDMRFVFIGSQAFNRDLSGWDVSNVTTMRRMFLFANAFDQDLGNWDISSVQEMDEFFFGSGISQTNYDNSLIGWESQDNTPSGITLTGNGQLYCNAETARASLITTKNWDITGDLLNCSALPVHLLKFDAHLFRDHIAVTWEPLFEINFDQYIIQKSIDGREWRDLESIPGEKLNQYRYEDYEPSPGINFYRLKQLDLDGTFMYSSIAQCLYEPNEVSVNIYPNPSSRFVNIQINDISSQDLKLTVINIFGQTVYSYSKSGTVESEPLTIEIATKGMYHVVSEIGSKRIITPLLIID